MYCNIKYITSCSWNPSLYGKFVVLAYRFHFIHWLLCQSHYDFVSFTRCSTEYSITRAFFIARKERIFTLVGFVIFCMLQCLLLVLLYFLLLMRCNFTSWICALVTFNILCVLYLIVTRHFFLQVDTSIKPVTKSYCCLSFLSRYVSSCFTRCFTVQLPRFELLTHSAFFNSTILYSLDC